MGVEPNNRGKTSKMDGENNGKPLLKWMIWGVKKNLFLVQHPLDPEVSLIFLSDTENHTENPWKDPTKSLVISRIPIQFLYTVGTC